MLSPAIPIDEIIRSGGDNSVSIYLVTYYFEYAFLAVDGLVTQGAGHQ